MIKSLRWRLQIWYTALWLTVVGGFGSILYLQTRASKMQEIDGQLLAAALNLDAKLGALPPHELDSKDPPPPPPPPKEKKKGKFEGKKGFKGFGPPPRDWGGPPRDWGEPPPPPPPPNRDRLLGELKLPPELENPPGLPDGERPYFVIWRGDESVMKATPLPDGVTRPPLEDVARPQFEQRGEYREVSMRGPRSVRLVVGR